jgi:hypothetical protein
LTLERLLRNPSSGESEIIEFILNSEGIPSIGSDGRVIHLEIESTNTLENILNSRSIIRQIMGSNPASIQIVTMPPHVLRAYQTGLKVFESEIRDNGWCLKAEPMYVPKADDFKLPNGDWNHEKIVRVLGWSIGYPESFRKELPLNRHSEFERLIEYSQSGDLARFDFSRTSWPSK